MNPIYRIKKRFRSSKRSKSFLLNIARTLMQLHHRIGNSHREIATSHQSFVMTRDRLQGLIICISGVGAFVVLNIVPVWGDYFFHCGELVYAARLAASAQHALLNGDFPLQYANDFDIALRPIFLYYTPTYYGIAGLTQIITGLEPYRVMLILIIVMALSATCGTYFTARLLGGGPVMSGLAATTLPISPYFMTDIFARGAFAELSAWAVFPWMTYCFIKFCCRPQMQSGLLFILTTGLLIICHKIFFPWAVIWLALLGLLLFAYRPDSSAGLNHHGHCSLRMLFLQCVYVLEISSRVITVHSISVPTFDVCDHVRHNCCWSHRDSCCARFACICLRYILRGARPSFCRLLVAR